MKRIVLIAALLATSAGICHAGGKVSYPDGTPVVNAEVLVHLQEVDKFKLVTDAQGRFNLPTMDFLDAFVQIKAPDGKDYATVNLPIKVFDGAEVAVVLQPKN
jgi:hypothetical protein